MEQTNPIVSVIMPCYNDGAYIQEAIDSVKAQTYPHIELIVIDDNSSDPETIKILNTLASQDVTVLHTQHVGPSGARNYGIRHAKGRYILPVDADDIILPTYIEKAVAAIDAVPERGVVYCHAELFGTQNGPWDLPDFSLEQMLLYNVVFVTSLFYKEDWERLGGFNENMKHGLEDYDFWIGMMELGRDIYQLPETLFRYRFKKKSRSTQLNSSLEATQMMYQQIYENHPDFYNKHRDLYVKVLRDALTRYQFNNMKLARYAKLYHVLKKFPPAQWIARLITR